MFRTTRLGMMPVIAVAVKALQDECNALAAALYANAFAWGSICMGIREGMGEWY
jgi:hypothetical protein